MASSCAFAVAEQSQLCKVFIMSYTEQLQRFAFVPTLASASSFELHVFVCLSHLKSCSELTVLVSSGCLFAMQLNFVSHQCNLLLTACLVGSFYSFATLPFWFIDFCVYI